MVSRLLRSPRFPRTLQAPILVATAAAILLALRPPERSEMNPGAALVWQLWWTLLPFFILPTARLWCAVCPFSALGDLAQQLRRLTAPLPPARLRAAGPWMAALGLAIMGFLFLLLSLESSGPFTALLLLAFASGALVSSLLWRGRAWCRYLCPLGLMAGLYSRLAWLRLANTGDSTTASAAAARCCPLFTSPASARRAQDCVLCGSCMKAPGGGAIDARVERPTPSRETLSPPEAVAVSLLLGLLLADALRMTPPYLWYMVRAVPAMGGDYGAAMALGIAGIVALLLLHQGGAALVSGGGRWSWPAFGRLSLLLLPLALAAQLALSAQHLMAAGDVLRNLGAELGLLDPDHMPPVDAYGVVWPLKGLQLALLAAGSATSLYLAAARGVVDRLSLLVPALPALALLAIFWQPMSLTC